MWKTRKWLLLEASLCCTATALGLIIGDPALVETAPFTCCLMAAASGVGWGCTFLVWMTEARLWPLRVECRSSKEGRA
jgi:hypothetical protein